MDFFARQDQARDADALAAACVLRGVALIVVAAWTSWSPPARCACRSPLPRRVPRCVLARFVVLAVIGGPESLQDAQLRDGGGVVARSLGGTRIGGRRPLQAQRLHQRRRGNGDRLGRADAGDLRAGAGAGINAFAAGTRRRMRRSSLRTARSTR